MEFVLSAQEFNMQSVQRRLSRMRGERSSNEEKLEQEEKIRQLIVELDEKSATHHALNGHIKSVNVRLRCFSFSM